MKNMSEQAEQNADAQAYPGIARVEIDDPVARRQRACMRCHGPAFLLPIRPGGWAKPLGRADAS